MKYPVRRTKEWYQGYLKTPHWRRFSASIKKKRGKCEQCGSRYRLEVHHKHYKNVGFEKPSDVLVLCHECHMRLHESIDASKKQRKRAPALILVLIAGALLFVVT